MPTKITTIILKASEWLRGDTNSMLYREHDDKMCCLGVACMHFGADAAELLEYPGLSDMTAVPNGLTFLMEKETEFAMETPLASQLYGINDSLEGTPSDKERCEQLNEALIANDAPIRFEFAANK